MKPHTTMFALAIASAIGLTAANILTGESLNVLLLGLVPAGTACCMGALIRYTTKQNAVKIEA